MTSKTCFRHLFVLLFTFSLTLTTLNVSAQFPAGVDPNNLSNVKVDDLTDEQISLLLKNTGTSEISIEQGAAMAIQRGMPASEVEKLKIRISKLQNPENNNKISTNGSNQITDQILEADKLKEKTSKDKIGLATNENKLENLKIGSTIYGQEFFRNADIKIFDKTTDAKAPEDYVIGINDEIAISIFGNSFYNEVLKVDSRGAINPNQMGPIFVKGLTFQKMKSLIKSKMRDYFDLNNNKLDVTLAYSRNITVNIVGEVLNPGSYNLPATNTAFNALILAGGPNDIGSLRNIEIRRNGKIIRVIDIYTFINNPNSTQNYYLEDNDYILVNSLRKVVKIVGEVKRPHKYELLAYENLNEIIRYAGGLNAVAYTDRIQIKRISAKELKIIDLNFDSLNKHKKNFELLNGDEILINASINEIRNKVNISGAINFPGEYNFEKDMKLTQFISKIGGLKISADLKNSYIVRVNIDMSKVYFKINLEEAFMNANSIQNITLQPLDEIIINSLNDNVESFNIQVIGAIKKGGQFDFVKGMTLGDAIRNAGGFKVEAENLRIEIARLDYFSNDYVDGQDVRIKIDKITLFEGSNYLNDSNSRYKLQPFDQIFVRSVPNFETISNVTINGEVKYPGVYTITSKDEKLSSLIKRSGGISRFAFAEAATFYRPTLDGGYIVFDLNRALKSDKSKYNYTLKAGDIINIPTVSDFVSIRGNTIEYTQVTGRQQVNAPFVNGRRAKYYIKEFGNGFTKDSWKKKTYVVQPNTKINRTKDFYLFKVYPKVTKGSTIYVVQKIKKQEQLKKEKEPFNWNKFVENTTLKITGLATLFVLLNQIKL